MYNTDRWLLALGILQTPKRPSSFLGWRFKTTFDSSSNFSSEVLFLWPSGSSAEVNGCKRVAYTHGENSLANFEPSTKYGAFEYSIFNIFYYYSNDLFFHFKMPLKRRNSLFWNLKIFVQFKFVFKEINWKIKCIFSLICNTKELAMKNKEVAIKTVKTTTVTVMDGWNGAKLP